MFQNLADLLDFYTIDPTCAGDTREDQFYHWLEDQAEVELHVDIKETGFTVTNAETYATKTVTFPCSEDDVDRAWEAVC